MPHHTTFEHSVFSEFSPTHHQCTLARRLLRSNPKLFKIDASSSGTPYIAATHHVGILRLAQTTLQILPKMFNTQTIDPQKQCREATQNLLTMLSYAHDLPPLHHAAPLHHHSHDWLELLTNLFAKNLRTQLHAAPHRTYQSFDDDLPLLRGKLRIADQLRRPDRQHRFACTFDEFSIDNPLNRIFRFVTERLFFQTHSPENRQLLNELRTLLDEVQLLARCTPADADPARLLSRLNRRYQPTLELARLFLSNSTPQLSPGRTDTINFLFNMNTLFESFIANFLKKHHQEIFSEISNLKSTSFSIQSPCHSLAKDSNGRSHFQLRPDIVFTHNHNHPLIIDTKYKRLDPTAPRYGISPADFYQMLAYAHRYHCPNILLLYPQTADLQSPLHYTFTIPNSSTTITAATIDLTRDLTTRTGRAALAQELRTLLALTLNALQRIAAPLI